MPGNPTRAPGSRPGKGDPQFMPVSMFGMNLYLTGLERGNSEAATLGTMAAQGGVRWAREELSWANIEPNAKGQFNWSIYDQRLNINTQNGIEVVGMLLTTPRWATTNPNAPDWYWYEPRNYNDYYDFVRAAVTRWRNQVHVWEIWNEPNHTGTWNCLNNCDRAARYASLLAGAYAAVKSVDPNARVLIGGLYVHDYNNEGMAFLNRVVQASGGAIYFDGLSIHTYMPDRIPESMRPDSVVQNYQYRLHMTNDWINAHGGRPAEIWVTEEGKSTCTTCPFRWSEEDQANMLTRMYGISMAAPRVVHFNYFQFEDKFNNPADMWGGMSIVRDNFTVKPAYVAYQTAARLLDGATYTGPGPHMIPGNNPHQPDSSDWVGFDYRFVRNDTALHLVWRPNDIVNINYPVETSQVDVVDRDGGTRRVTWIKELRSGRKDDDEGILARWSRELSTSEGVARIISYVGYALLALLALFVIGAELRAAGLFDARRRAAARNGPEAQWRRRLMLADVAAAPLAERPGMLLRLLGEALTRAHRLPAADGLTAGAIARRAQVDAESERAELARVARTADDIRYADRVPPAADLEATVERAQALLAKFARLGSAR
jgi:hypothetical protein